MNLEDYRYKSKKKIKKETSNTCHNYIQQLKLYDNDTKMGKSKNIIEDSETNSNVDKDLLCDVSSISNQWERKDYFINDIGTTAKTFGKNIFYSYF